jgi:hypothetical protein
VAIPDDSSIPAGFRAGDGHAADDGYAIAERQPKRFVLPEPSKGISTKSWKSPPGIAKYYPSNPPPCRAGGAGVFSGVFSGIFSEGFSQRKATPGRA